jgi:hypothetical protein
MAGFSASPFISDAAAAASDQKFMLMKAALGTQAKSPRPGRQGLSIPENRNERACFHCSRSHFYK